MTQHISYKRVNIINYSKMKNVLQKSNVERVKYLISNLIIILDLKYRTDFSFRTSIE